MSWKKSDEHV